MKGALMAGSVNKVILIGNLGADPEVAAHARWAVNLQFEAGDHGSWRDKQTGEKRDKTEWHSVVFLTSSLVKLPSNISRRRKGYLEGQLQTRKWQDNTVTTATRRKLCCKIMLGSSRCSMAGPALPLQ